MSELLKFHTPTVNNGNLEIKVENISGAKLDGKLLIEVQLPLTLVNSQVRDAAEQAGIMDETPNFASLAGVVTTAPSWTVWAFNTPKVAAIRVYNHLHPETAKPTSVSAMIEAAASLTLRIPLAEKDPRVQVSIPYSYQYGGREATTIYGTLELITAGAGACSGKVSFTTDQISPTMISAGTPVKLFWEITGGVSAVIRGPMSGGHSELRLSSDSDADYKIEKGSYQITAVGAATYMLDAEVCGANGQPNVQIVRTLFFNVKKASQYSNLMVRPSRVLPNGEVDLEWAVSGVKGAKITVGDRKDLTLQLTEQDLSRNFHGAGIWRIDATNKVESVTLEITDATDDRLNKKKELTVTQWINWIKRGHTGKLVAMAVAVPKVALLTADGLWLSTVGRDDNDKSGETDRTFRKVATETPKAWLALTAFDKNFVALQQTAADGLRLARYKSEGTPPGALLGTPVDLPDTVKTIATNPNSFFDLAPFDNRVYVVAQTPDGLQRRAFSVRFEPAAEIRPEPWLERLTHYRLLIFDDALHAINRDTGAMLRFDLTSKGELEEPRKAASVTLKGQSLIRKGLLVPIGSALVVLDPEPFEGLRSSDLVGITGAISGLSDRATKADPEQLEVDLPPTEPDPQDLIYNPQTNEWSACGHGLKIKPGAVAAYRGGASKRLWVLQPDGELFTLTGASEELFAQDYIKDFPSADLPSLFDRELKFKLVNQTGFNLVPVDDVCRAAGVHSFNGLANLEPMPDKVPQQSEKDFTLKYNKDDPSPIHLRFLVEGSPGPRYFLEVTFSGLGLKSITSAFKRLAGDGKVAEIPGSAEQHSADRPIVVSRVGQLTYKTKLFILNVAPHSLGLNPGLGINYFEEKAEIPLTYASTSFVINVPSTPTVGSVGVTLDFAMPPGIETSPGGEAQRRLVRITTDQIHMLDLYTQPLTGSPTAAPIVFKMYDGTVVTIPGQSTDCVVCQVGVKTKKELDGIRLGDAAPSDRGWLVFIPLAKPQGLPNATVYRTDAGGFYSTDKAQIDAKGGVFSMPNSVSASKNFVHGVFGDTTIYEIDYDFKQTLKKASLTDYTQITALTAATNGDLYIVAAKSAYVDHQLTAVYYLVAERVSRPRVNLLIQNKLSFPVIGPPLALSPDGKTLAICQPGGLLVVDVQGEKIQTENIQTVRLSSAREPAHVRFSRDGVWIYCAHVTRVMSGNPRRTVAGRELTVSRVRVGSLTDTKTLSLPDVQSNFGLTGNTKQSFRVGEQSKEEVAFTLAVSPDSSALFVSAGTEILKIDTASFTLTQWRATVDLPCRLSHVMEARGNAWTVHALGSYYVGDGTTVEQYKTHLYAIPAPKK